MSGLFSFRRLSRSSLATITVLLLVAALLPWGFSKAFAADPSGSFEDADGNLVHNSLTDWADVGSSSQFSAEQDLASGTGDNSYGQGAKEDDTSPTVVSGQIPNNKADLLRDYVYWKKDSDGHLLVYLAYETANFTGSAHIDFEINQSQVMTANGVNPVRTPGDILITYDWNGSSAVVVGYATWLNTNQWSAVTAFPSGQGQGASNTVTVHDPIQNVDLAPGEFGEAGVDLTAANLVPAGQCVDFASVLVKSRSSGESFQSELKDFIAPNPVSISNCGTIIVKKVTDPAGASGFTFTGDAHGTIGDGDTITVHDLVPGTYTSTESTKSGWELSSINCDNADGSGNVGTRTATFDVHAGETTTCTFTNTQQAKIVVKKLTDPSSATDKFSFTGSSGVGTIDDLGNNDTWTSGFLSPGNYTVTESAKTGWDLTHLACDDGASDNASTGVVATRIATYRLDPGETVTCTYTNTERGSITVKKVSDPPGGKGFTFTGDAAGTIDDGGTITTSNLVPGTYTSTESDPSGYTLSGIVCDDPNSATASSGDTATRTATFNVDPGENVTCTFTNTQLSHIIVKKVTQPSGSSQSFDFTATGGPSALDQSFGLTDGQTHDTGEVLPGSGYAVSETVPAGWDQTGATCDNENSPSAVTVAPGETVTCTFTNTQRGHLVVVKRTVPSGSSQSFDFTVSGGPSTVAGFSLTDGQSHDSGAILPGSGYSVSEAAVTGWKQTGASCDNGNAPSAVTVAPGQTVTCTFTNTHYVSLAVTKAIVANGDSVPAGGFSFTVSCTDGTNTTLNFTAAGTQSVDGIVDGSTCTVTEASTTGWTVTPSAQQTVVVGPNGGAVTFTNTRDTGVITVTKSTVGAVAGASTVFTFDVVCPISTFNQTLTIDTATQTSATSTAIPTGMVCTVVEESTAGWQQTTPAQGGVDVTVPGTATFENTRLTGPLQLSKSVTPTTGSYSVGDPNNTLTYTLSLSPTGSLDHTNVVVTDYIPGYDPSYPKSGKTTYVANSATCSTGCSVTYDATHHQLTWAVGNVNHGDAAVIMKFKVTIDQPAFDTSVGLPIETIDNIGFVKSTQQAKTPSNLVKTPVEAVLGIKVVRPPAVLPFTGMPIPATLVTWAGMLMVGVGVALTTIRRRRRS